MNLTLTINQFVQLEQELSALSKEKLPFLQKYKIAELQQKVNPILKPYHDLCDEAIKELGTENPQGGFGIPVQIEKDGAKVVNPALKEYNDRIEPIGKEEREIEFEAFKLEEFTTLTTSTPYSIFFKFVQK